MSHRYPETDHATRAAKFIENEERVHLPMLTVWREHTRMLVLGTFATVTTFMLFYLMTVFTLSWGTSALGYTREDFLLLQIIGVLFFAVTIPVSAAAADRIGRHAMLVIATVCIGQERLAAFGSPLHRPAELA